MNIKEILYIIEHQHHLVLYSVHQDQQIINDTIDDYFNKQCLRFGYTLKGAIYAIRYHLKIKQRVPILVHPYQKILFFPILINQNTMLWLRYHPSMAVKQLGAYESKIIVVNHQLFCDVNVRVIRRQIKRCARYIDILVANELEWECYLERNKITIKLDNVCD